jgi:hypothetical protein
LSHGNEGSSAKHQTAKIVVPGEFDKFIAKLDSVEVSAEEIENPTHAELTEGS